MDVQLTPDQQAFVGKANRTGRLDREQDAVRERAEMLASRKQTKLWRGAKVARSG